MVAAPQADHHQQHVGRGGDEHLARLEAEAQPTEPPAADTPTEDVRQARDLVAGKVAVMIGGCRRPHAHDALVSTLGLAELRWINTHALEGLDRITAEAGRTEVDLVLMAIRWSSHGLEEVKWDCEAMGSVYVRLPRSYGVNQDAREIVAQASEALGATCESPS